MVIMINWTTAQQNAIDGKDCSIIVSAGAGSGKTAVLVERLLKILSNKELNVSADKIIVVTFTKDSANEMKQRLMKAISKRLDEEPQNEWLVNQHSMLPNAKICTIHSFCFDLIRDNITELDISANFKIVEPTEENTMLIKSTNEVIEQAYEDFPEDMLFLSETLCDKTDNALNYELIKLYHFMMSVPFYNDWFTEKCIEYYSKEDLHSDQSLDYCFNALQTSLKEALKLSDKIVSLLEDDTETTQKSKDVLLEENQYIHNALEFVQSSERFNVDTLKKFSNYKFNRATIKGEYKSIITQYRNEYKSILTDDKTSSINFSILADVIEHYHSDKQINKRVSQILQILLNRLHEHFSIAKKEENCLSFNDAEQLAIKLLAYKDENGTIQKTKLAKELTQYYKIIMIDEFQDSNNNQDLIFKMLSQNDEMVEQSNQTLSPADVMGKNMFVVGDVKQSIYAFRLANPKNFLKALHSSKPYNEDSPQIHSYINLNQNFRSSQPVIDFVNYLFENSMSYQVGEVDYNDEEKLIYGANYSDTDSRNGNPIDRSTEIPIIDTEKYTSPEYVANTIKSMIDSKYPVTDKDGYIRACRLSDFCLLFMATSSIPEYYDRLYSSNLDVHFEEDEEYLKSREVSLLISMMKVVENPINDMALTSILISPLFMFTPDDVATIRLVNMKGSIYSSMLKIVDEEYLSYPTELLDKINYLIEVLSDLRNYSTRCTTYELMKKIIDVTDLISIMQVYDTNNNKRRENIQILLKIAQNHDSVSTTGISGFLRYINSILDSQQDFDIKRSNSVQDAIHIKTIHKSKGLEFPFVFLCNIERNFYEKDVSESIIKSFEYGISYRLKDRRNFIEYTTLDRIRLANQTLFDIRSEKLRLFYVALTRAKERLFIPLPTAITHDKNGNPTGDLLYIQQYINHINDDKEVSCNLVQSAKSMKSILLMVLSCCDKTQPLRRYFDVNTDYLLHCKSNINIYEYSNKPKEDVIATDTESIDIENATIDTIKRDEILNRCYYRYPNSQADLPANVSVSAIAKKNVTVSGYAEGSNLPQPKFLNRARYTAMERGTTLHTILQYANFKALSEDTTKEVSRLVENGYISREQYEDINKQYIVNFVHSEVFKLAMQYPIEREKNIFVKLSDLKNIDEIKEYKHSNTMLEGCVDLMVFEPDGITLIDYKTDNVSSMQELVDRYRLQIVLYKSAIELTELQRVKRSIIYSLRLGKYIEV